MTARVAAVIPTYNSAELLEDCLRSVAWCDEIIVVDMHSTDNTDEICARFPNCRVFKRDGYIYENFNYGMDQARSEWIIRLDTDERISPELRDEIRELLSSSEEPPHAAYTAPMVVYIIGKRLDWGPERGRVRNILVRRGRARYPTRTEHEDFMIDGTVGALHGPYHHYSTKSIGHFIHKMNYYTDRDLERHPHPVAARPRTVLSVAVRHFFHVYFRQKAYRDGYHGFVLAALRSIYIVVSMLKEWEKAEGWRERHRQLVAGHYDDLERGGGADG